MSSDGKWLYQTVKENISLPEIENQTTYGIQVISVHTVHDVSVNKQFVEHLAAIFTENQLSPIHLYDVLEDMLP